MSGYKVVRRYPNGQLWSAVSDPEDISLWTQYTPNRYAVRRRDYGPLLVFRGFHAAICFIAGMGDPSLEVWECEYTVARDKHEHCMWQADGRREAINWRDSACAHSVKLIRKVQ